MTDVIYFLNKAKHLKDFLFNYFFSDTYTVIY